MNLKLEGSSQLPILAWCARIQKGDDTVTLFHGSAVQCRDDAFVEGAWDGCFEDFKFLESTVMCGTGGRLEGNVVRFTGSTDRLAPLFSIETADSYYVSNSLLLIMGTAGEAPDPIYPYYAYDLVRIWRQGLHCLDGELPLSSGNRVGIHFGVILSVDIHGKVSFENRDPGEVPKDYQHYHSILLQCMSQVLANAEDPGRVQSYQSLAAISLGYDSSATAVLARDVGCVEAVTLLDSREEDPFLDSGKENAGILGMTCHEVDRWEYTKLNAEAVAEVSLFGISCCGPIAGFENILKGRIFISGHFGDTILSPSKAILCDELSQSWASFASGLNGLEFRLRAGFIAMAPLTILARHNHAIHRITHSEEMLPWHVAGSYNRPIARRIIEEGGLARGTFAINKRGGGHSSFEPKKKRADTSLAMQSYREFVKSHHSNVSPFAKVYWKFRVKVDHYVWSKLGPQKRKFVALSSLQRRFPFIVNAQPTKLSWEYMFTLQWAHALLSKYYNPYGK